jgi:acyl carrier protein
MAELIEWNDFAERISEFTGIDVDKISNDTNIYSDLGMDSLGLFSLGMFLIKVYNTKFPLSSVASLQTVGDIFKMSNNIRQNTAN